ncbi:MAG: Brp/Blh family beta-carotene 15,15'-dioxygenase [Pelobium sp.]
MKYINSKLFLAQAVIQFILIIWVLFFTVNLTTQAILSGVFLCIVGIPHGSNDYLYRENQSTLGLVKFLGSYLGIIALYALIWYYLPIVALILFFVISFHHFGQSNHENEHIWHLPSILWGVILIVLPVIIHFEEAVLIFKSMLAFNQSYAIKQTPLVQFILWKLVSFSILCMAYLISIYYLEKQERIRYMMQFALITIWYLLTPLLFGFIMVFCLWHSFQSLRHQKSYFQNRVKSSSGNFYLSMIPFSSIALAVFAAYLYYFDFDIGGAFILLSLITLPHVLVTHRQYQH